MSRNAYSMRAWSLFYNYDPYPNPIIIILIHSIFILLSNKRNITAKLLLHRILTYSGRIGGAELERMFSSLAAASERVRVSLSLRDGFACWWWLFVLLCCGWCSRSAREEPFEEEERLEGEEFDAEECKGSIRLVWRSQILSSYYIIAAVLIISKLFIQCLTTWKSHSTLSWLEMKNKTRIKMSNRNVWSFIPIERDHRMIPNEWENISSI